MDTVLFAAICTQQPIRPFHSLSARCISSFAKQFKSKERVMPEIIVHALNGPSVEQKRALIRDLTDAVVRNYNVDADSVTINIVEFVRENKARGGVLLTDKA